LEATHHEVEKLGGKAVVCPVDVASFEQVNQAAGKIENELGSITIWINNAMVSVFSPRVRVTMVHLPALNTPQFGWVKSRLPLLDSRQVENALMSTMAYPCG
jgi:hypothetical protein